MVQNEILKSIAEPQKKYCGVVFNWDELEKLGINIEEMKQLGNILDEKYIGCHGNTVIWNLGLWIIVLCL